MALLVGLAAAPSAAAAVRIVDVTLPAGPIALGDSAVVTLHAEADCTSLLSRAAPSVEQPVLANLSWTTSGGFVLAGPGTVDFSLAPCRAGASAAPGQAAVQVTPNRTTPALAPFTQVLRVALSPPLGGALDAVLDLDPAEASAELVVLAAPAVTSALHVVDTTQDCDRCPEVRFDVELSNEGNTGAVYTFEVTGRPEEPWTVHAPEPIELASPLEGGVTTATVTFVVHPPATRWAFGSFAFVIHSTAAGDDQTRGAPLTAAFLVANTEVRQRDLPLAPFPLLVAAVAAALLARRRA